MFFTEQKAKKPKWYKGYDALSQSTIDEKAYEISSGLREVQFDTLEEAEDAVKKLNEFWMENFVVKYNK